MYLCDLPLATVSNFFKKQFDFTRTYTTDCLAWALQWQRKSWWTHYKQFFLIFKLYVYNSREKHHLSIMDLLTDIKEIKKTIPFIFQQWKQKKDPFSSCSFTNLDFLFPQTGHVDCIIILLFFLLNIKHFWVNIFSISFTFNTISIHLVFICT